MSDPGIVLRSVNGDRAAFIPLLLEADESEPVVRAYLNDGELLELVAAGQPVGVVLIATRGRVDGDLHAEVDADASSYGHGLAGLPGGGTVSRDMAHLSTYVLFLGT